MRFLRVLLLFKHTFLGLLFFALFGPAFLGLLFIAIIGPDFLRIFFWPAFLRVFLVHSFHWDVALGVA